MKDGCILQKQAVCHGYKMLELSNGLPIARTVSFREAVKIIETDVKYFNPIFRTDGTEDPFQ